VISEKRVSGCVAWLTPFFANEYARLIRGLLVLLPPEGLVEMTGFFSFRHRNS